MLFGILSLFLLFTQGAFGQNNVTYLQRGYVIEHWGVEEGLPVNSVNKIIQSSRGYLWLATNDGLVRFDGIRFRVFNSWEYPGMFSNRIDNITKTPDGVLWLETEQGYLITHQNGRFTRIDSSKKFNGFLVAQLYKDSRGRLWIGTDKGLNIYAQGELQTFHSEHINGNIDRIFVQKDGTLWFRKSGNLQIYRFDGVSLQKVVKGISEIDATPFFEDAAGTLWFSTGKGLYHYTNKGLNYVTGGVDIVDITQKSDTLWLATRSKGFFYLSDDKVVKTEQGAKTGRLLSGSFSIHQSIHTNDRRQHLWKVTEHAVYRDNTLILKLPNTITDFIIGHRGGIWLATYNDGLYRVKKSIFEVFGMAEGMPGENVYPVIEDKKGNIWAGLHGKGIVRISGGKVYSGYRFENSDAEVFIRSICQKNDGTILASELADGIYKLLQNKKLFVPYPSPLSLQHSTVKALFIDKSGKLYAASEKGLFIETNGKWVRYGADIHPGLNLVRTIAQAPNGDIWLGTNGAGIIRFSNNNFYSFTEKEGLSSNLIRSLYIQDTPAGYDLWVGTENAGLFYFAWNDDTERMGKIKSIDKSDGLFDNVIHTIINDENGRLWMSTNRGIFWVNTKELYAFINGKINEIHSTSYNEKDGMRNREANGGIYPAGTKAADGTLWFPTQAGVVAVNPKEAIGSGDAPKVIIEQLTADTTQVIFPNTISLKASQRDITIRYTALNFLSPQKLQFRYKIKELDEDWTIAGGRREAFFTNLPPGDFTFQVSAANGGGAWSKPASLTISIDPFFYETWWFFALCLLFVLMLGYAAVKQRTHRLEKTEQRLKQTVDERTKELRQEKRKTEQQAEDLKELDEAKSKFFANVSHEFRTPLTLILNPLQQLLNNKKLAHFESEKKQMKLMQRNGRRLMRLVNQLLDIVKLESGKLTITPQTIDMASFAKETLEMFKPVAEQQHIALNLSAPSGQSLVHADYKKMEQVLGNLIGNAIKFTPEGGEISVRVKRDAESVITEVEDTGPGIAEDKVEKVFERFYKVDDSTTRTAEGLGIGLALCKELVELHGGTLQAKNAKGKGACFIMQLPRAKEQKLKEAINSGQRSPLSGGDDLIPKPKAFGVKSGVGNESEHKPNYTRPEERTNILIVDDNADMRGYISSLLKDSYYLFTTANGIEALEQVQKSPPDLIIADIMMPEMDGATFNKKLKADQLWKNIPLIFLTARASDEDKISGINEGGDVYLTKPFNPDMLLSHIDNLLASHRRLRAQFMAAAGKPVDGNENISFIEKANHQIKTNFADPDFGVNELAVSLHVEQSTLYREVKKQTGKPPVKLLSNYRLNQSKALLEKGDSNISEIAYGCGFNSLSYFSKRFKEQFGCSPSEFNHD